MFKKYGSLLAITALFTTLAQANYDAKPLTTTKGGTGSATQSANIAVTTDGSGHLVSSGSTTATELGYVHGVTSAIQSQFSAASASLKALSWRPWVRIFDSTNTTLPTGTSYTEDGVTGVNGDRVLFTALSASNNRVYVLGGVGTSLTWTLATDGQSATGAPQEGDFLAISEGTANKQTLWQYNGTAFAQAGGGGGANTSLSNLTTTAINTDLLPGTSGSFVLGAPGSTWAKLVALLIDDHTGATSIDPDNRQLFASDGATEQMDWENPTVLKTVGVRPLAAATYDLGTEVFPWANIYVDNAIDNSGLISADLANRVLKDSAGNEVATWATPATFEVFNQIQLDGSSSGSVTFSSGATPTAHTVTVPPTVCSSGQYWADNGSGVMSCTTLVSPSLTVVDGGDTAYSIARSDGHVRTTTTLTAQRAYTLPACDASHIGERHEVKDTPAQTFNIVVTANGSDNIDGASTFTLNPGDSVSVICAAFSTNGTWDIE